MHKIICAIIKHKLNITHKIIQKYINVTFSMFVDVLFNLDHIYDHVIIKNNRQPSTYKFINLSVKYQLNRSSITHKLF